MGSEYQVMPWTGFCTLYGTSRVVAAAKKEIRRESVRAWAAVCFSSAARARDCWVRRAGVVPGAIGKRLSSTAATLAKSLELVSGRPNETALPLAYWRQRNPASGQHRDPSRDGCGLIWYAPLVPMRASTVLAYVELLTRITRAHRIEPLITLTTMNDRLFDSTVPLLFDRQDKDAQAGAVACFDELVEAGRQIGVFPYRIGIHAMQDLMERQTHAKAFHRRLRQALDPHDIVSPGRYV